MIVSGITLLAHGSGDEDDPDSQRAMVAPRSQRRGLPSSVFGSFTISVSTIIVTIIVTVISAIVVSVTGHL